MKSICNLHFAIFILQFLLPSDAFSQATPPESFPYRQPPVEYFSDQVGDPVWKLRNRIENGELALARKMQYEETSAPTDTDIVNGRRQ